MRSISCASMATPIPEALRGGKAQGGGVDRILRHSRHATDVIAAVRGHHVPGSVRRAGGAGSCTPTPGDRARNAGARRDRCIERLKRLETTSHIRIVVYSAQQRPTPSSSRSGGQRFHREGRGEPAARSSRAAHRARTVVARAGNHVSSAAPRDASTPLAVGADGVDDGVS